MNNDIPQDIYFALAAEYSMDKYAIAVSKSEQNNVYHEILRVISLTDSFELAGIQTTIQSVEEKHQGHNIYYEKYTVEFSLAGTPICTNVFTTQSPSRFGHWEPMAPRLQTVYRLFKQNAQPDASDMSVLDLIQQRQNHRLGQRLR